MITLSHVSPSSILLFLNNPAAWRTKYILGIRDQKSTPAALTGSAFHKYLEARFKNPALPASVYKETALAFMNSVTDVDWGKTGSLEDCQIALNKLIDHWNKEHPSLGETVAVEKELLVKVPGIRLPVKAVIDYIHVVENKIVITDWKTVAAYQDKPTPAQILQGCLYYFVVKKTYDLPVARFDVVQIKASTNKDGSPQIKTNSIDFAERQSCLSGVKKLADLSVREMMKKRKVFLPNLRDDYESEESFNSFLLEYEMKKIKPSNNK
jgi:hypothetical protein